jgi:hypothetical protein
MLLYRKVEIFSFGGARPMFAQSHGGDRVSSCCIVVPAKIVVALRSLTALLVTVATLRLVDPALFDDFTNAAIVLATIFIVQA